MIKLLLTKYGGMIDNVEMLDGDYISDWIDDDDGQFEVTIDVDGVIEFRRVEDKRELGEVVESEIIKWD